MADVDTLKQLFESVGLSEQRAKDTARNKKLGPALKDIINFAGPSPNANVEKRKAHGELFYTLASTSGSVKEAAAHLEYLAKAIHANRLTSNEQIGAALKFVQNRVPGSIDSREFDNACGVGVVVSSEEVKRNVQALLAINKIELVTKRYSIAGRLLIELRQSPNVKWANGQVVKEEFDAALFDLLGPKDERDAPKKQKKEKPALTSHNIAPPPRDTFAHLKEGEMLKLHKPGENKQIHESLMQEHLAATHGKVQTRFPPEPNGYLHIGHAKAININFGYARIHGGTCNLRYDDTNPEAEEQIYLDSIKETVEWLGFKPDQITYSSDHFSRLYDLAVKLITRSKAYVCHCTAEEIHAQRGGDLKGPRYACSHRTRPIHESLNEFARMRAGEYKEGKATLRMKMDLESGNPQFWDLIAYRVLHTTHHRTNARWCIYPTYDYTHCLCDSFENITHSLCTTEFQLARESYYWLCDALEVYKPVQWEYGRLNVTRTVLSKRKIAKLVETGLVSGWDDPRLYTLPALRRRGVPPEAINSFVREVGVTTASAITDVGRLDNHVRDVLNERAPRIMAILDPVLVRLENLPKDHLEMLQAPNKPRDPTMGSHVVPFTSRLYIDASDFRDTADDPNYFRLAPGRTVGLLYVPNPITLLSIHRNGTTTELVCRYEQGPQPPKPKTYIQWVADSSAHNSPVRIESVRLYNPLFLHSNPMDKALVPGGFLNDINPHSLETVRTAIAEVGLREWLRDHPEARAHPETLQFQFLRIGYFCVDKDSVWDKDDSKVADGLFLNKTVDLKEDRGKE